MTEYEYNNNELNRSEDTVPVIKEKKSGARKFLTALVIALVSLMLVLTVFLSVFVSQLLIEHFKNSNGRIDEAQITGTVTEPAIGLSTEPAEETEKTEPTDKQFSIEDASRLPDTATRKSMSTVEIASKVSPATVSVLAEVVYNAGFGDASFEASGSGFVISDDGYIVTNYHVISGASNVSVVIPGYGEPIEAEVVGTDSKMDIAVLKVITEEKLPHIILGDSDLLQVGELAVAIGNPFGELAGTVTVGVISALNREITIDSTVYTLLQTDASINSGNSGGPLVNSYGEVIGVTNAKMNSAEGIGFAIPINNVKSIIEELINKGYVSGRPILGIYVVAVDATAAESFNWPTGLFVRGVTEDGPADQAGLKVEDIITHVNGQEVQNSEQLLIIRDSLSVGDEMEMTVFRDGETLTLTLILGEGKLT